MHRRSFNWRGLHVIGIELLLGLPEVLLDFALELLGAALDVLAGVVGGIP